MGFPNEFTEETTATRDRFTVDRRPEDYRRPFDALYRRRFVGAERRENEETN